ncbi:class A beta-lactamase-related serine hydrolase [Streptomyces caatingaensis]|uniref:class A beta-lactamase-related serine hydrolase n=1 Tax=Streptomyces caatingaensis TaxID=1678637 RepID=UPI001F5264E0|nr:class A beta-lactamase-related serine hydrolase [Streptomyces caatingaensis]
MPTGVSAGVAVYDRCSGTFAERLAPDARFRSASVVKLLIALDHLWDRGPVDGLPPADRTRLAAMLASSDDSAAGHFWERNGGTGVITRMVSRLGLTGTAGPPPRFPGHWGYSAVTAADVVRVWRHLLDDAPPAQREAVLGPLRRATRYGTDGFDQFFGIPSAFARPWAVKQGWSGYPPAARPTGVSGTGVDLRRPALHTTGAVGPGDRAVVAVLTLHPPGTPYAEAGAAVTEITRSLRVPGAVLL